MLVRYNYPQMETLPGSGDLLECRHVSLATGKRYSRYFKMLKWKKNKAWLVSCDINGITLIGGTSDWVSWRDVPRLVLKKCL